LTCCAGHPRTLRSSLPGTFLLGAYPPDGVIAYVAARAELASGQRDVQHDHRLDMQAREALPGLGSEIGVLIVLSQFSVGVGRVQDLGDVPLDV